MTNEVSYESITDTERMVIRQTLHPEAARALREFASEIVYHDGSTLRH